MRISHYAVCIPILFYLHLTRINPSILRNPSCPGLEWCPHPQASRHPPDHSSVKQQHLPGAFHSKHGCGLVYDQALFYYATVLATLSLHELGSNWWVQSAALQPGIASRGKMGCASSYENNRKRWLTGGKILTSCM